MKNFLVVLIVMLTAGCAGTGMRSSGSSGDSGYSSGDCTGANMNNPECIYFPGFTPPASPAFKGMDESFQPYFGG